MLTAKAFAVPVAVLLVLTISLTLLFSTGDLRSRLPLPFLSSTAVAASCSPLPASSSPSPLRVYMYDLPRRFNLGMLDRRPDAPAGGAGLPPWPRNSGLKRQHSVEYWMMASLLAEAEEGVEAVRVRGASEADVFFVPFFSSLSFNSHGHNMTDPETEVDRQLQVDLLEILKASEYWQRSGGRDHVIPMSHPNAFRFLRDLVNASIFVVADFGRYPRNVSYLSKDVVAPYVHLVDSFVDDDLPDPFESRKTLLFFRGRTVRKDEGVVRAKLSKILKGQDGVEFEDSLATGEAIKASSTGMRSSKFCLHPAGDTPSSCRLFDAIVSHCVPVIVSNHIELPYESEIDYRDFSLFFSHQEALKPGYMLARLREFPKERWLKIWGKLKNISHHYEFQYPPKKDDAVNMLWRQVRQKLPAINLALHRSGRLKIPDWWRRRR